MSSFLQEVANDLLKKYQGDLSEYAVVFPSRRAGIFFKHHLFKIATKVMWAPKITSISELMQEFSSLQPADPLSLVFDLYKEYLSEKKTPEPFDDFYFWGTVMLNDFEEIDKYKINAKALFTNIAQNRNMSMQFDYLDEDQKKLIGKFWDSFTAGSVSKHQENFLKNWDILYPVYENFRNQLRNAGKGYDGMIYREVAEQCENGKLDNLPYKKIILVGFNALNQCEKVFFRWLNKAKRADFYWDTDPYYLDNTVHEAGRFIRDNIKEYGGWTRSETGMTADKKIRFISVPSNISQTKLTGQLLESIDASHDEEQLNIAIVLPDEELLVPALTAIPEKYRKVNVTMGLTLKDSPVYDFIIQLQQLQTSVRQVGDKLQFYYKPVLGLLENPVFTGVCEATGKITSEIRKNNMMFIDAGLLAVDDFMEIVFQKIEGVEDLCSYFIEILEMAARKTEGDSDVRTEKSLHTEFIYHAFLSLQRLRDLLTEKQLVINSDTFTRLLKKVLASVEVAFHGEPLAGIQVMGVLETRLLDFDRLIILSMNEGVFPRKSAAISFIPQSLRKAFGLPAIGHQDAIYSYYFFRLIQRADQVTLVYNTQSGGMKSGEPSRFLYQMKYSGQFKIEDENLSVSATSGKIKPISIEKSPVIMETLNSYLVVPDSEKGRYLSPSSINTWLQCRLKFYFRIISGLREPEVLSEEVDARMLGNLLHKSAELIYSEVVGKPLGAEDFKKLSNKDNIRKIVIQAFSSEYFQNINNYAQIELKGRDLIVSEILQNYLKQIIRVDSRIDHLKILAVEKRVNGEFHFESDGKSLSVRLGGVIDRLDEANNAIRIIDYKTGSDSQSVRDISVLFKRGNNYGAIFQLLIYTWLLKQELNFEKQIIPGMYKMQSVFNEDFDFRLRFGKDTFTKFDEVSETLKEGLSQILAEIYNPEAPFEQVNDEKICRYCAYRSICFPGRNKQFSDDNNF